MLIEMMSFGASVVEVCKVIGVDRKNFYEWLKKYPELKEAKDYGYDLAEAWWLEQGRINLENRSFHYVGWYMNMKNRFKWRDKSEHKIKGLDKKGDDLTKAQRDATYAAAMISHAEKTDITS